MKGQIFGIILMLALVVPELSASKLESEAYKKIDQLNTLIKKAEKEKIDVLREKMTVRTAEVFLEYAEWDEQNLDINIKEFKSVAEYKNKSEEVAKLLPDFERQEVIKMLDESIDFLNQLIKGEVSRKQTPNVDWSQSSHQGDQITFDNRPVFLADWTWKPRIERLTEYHGNQDGFFISPSQIQNEHGSIKPKVINELKSKPNGSLGFIFINHKGTPNWAKKKYGEEFEIAKNVRYTEYDIDNPGAREMMGYLLEATVPKMANKKFSELGYMLCNEPHFYTSKKGDKLDWASGPVSSYTKEKFRDWLSKKHKSIDSLNTLWKTYFSSFNSVDIEIPIDQSLLGTPMWYDWTTFNMYRVSDWYMFMKEKIKMLDPNAKVHLKVMPNLWTENNRGSGIDMEALTRMSDIIGNDCAAEYNHMWKKQEWMEHYQYDWRELSMSHDFFKSVSPNKIMYNTEGHYLSTVRSRDLYQNSQYVRSTYWLALTSGMTATQTWFWARREGGSIRKQSGNGYAGSNNQQPRVVNEVHRTFMDANAYAEEVMAMQRLRKPIRIYYTKASAVNKKAHMDDVFELYEALNFEGVPLGFMTHGIIEEQSPNAWDVVAIYKTPYVKAEDITAVQSYIDAGGKVFIDEESFKMDQYGRAIKGLQGATLIKNLASMKIAILAEVDKKGSMPSISLTETPADNIKGCTWKTIENQEGNHVVSIVNLGKTEASLKLQLKGANSITLKNLWDGTKLNSEFVIQPYETKFIEVKPQ